MHPVIEMQAPSLSLSSAGFFVGENLVPIFVGEPPVLSQEGVPYQPGCVGPSKQPTRSERRPQPQRRRGNVCGASSSNPTVHDNMAMATPASAEEVTEGLFQPSVVNTDNGAHRGQCRGGGRRGGRSAGRGRRQRTGEGEVRNLLPVTMLEGWVAPSITVDRASPVQLRPRPMLHVKESTPPLMELNCLASDGDSDFTTPPPRSQSTICRYTLIDFEPGAPVPDTLSRQSIGGYFPWQHDCGEKNCPFAEGSSSARRRAVEQGLDFETTVSPGQHVRVDHRAFQQPQHVLVKLATLGLDSSLWGEIEHFRGLVRHRYYHEVTGAPMYTVDFDGGIGFRELRVCDTTRDHSIDSPGSARRVLDFGAGTERTSESGGHSTAAMSHVTSKPKLLSCSCFLSFHSSYLFQFQHLFLVHGHA